LRKEKNGVPCKSRLEKEYKFTPCPICRGKRRLGAVRNELVSMNEHLLKGRKSETGSDQTSSRKGGNERGRRGTKGREEKDPSFSRGGGGLTAKQR